MSRHNTRIYRELLRNKVKKPSVKERQLTPEQILSLRYQCAVESKDFETVKALKALMGSQGEDNKASKARQKAEQLFRKEQP